MDILSKLEILSDAAKYDVACTSSGSTRENKNKGLGNGYKGGICHTWSADGRCISLLKVLMTNICVYDCAYCVNRLSNDVPRAAFTPDELVQLTISFYRRNYIEGLFLSSAVIHNPDHTMELMLRTIKKLRLEQRFNGYIHIKAIPGTSREILAEAGRYADRLSVNIELPTQESLKRLAPQKKKDAILTPMKYISSSIQQSAEEHKAFRSAPRFAPAGQSTQLIVGATGDPDLSILRLSEGLYKRYRLKRVFYSAYVPVSSRPELPSLTNPPLLREHRLYQADWLLRFYGFSSSELLNEENPDFDTEMDPKSCWALRNLHLFPVEINKADLQLLLRVPGIGVKSAKQIVTSRRATALDYECLKKLGVVLKRARHFITCKGKYYGESSMNELYIRQHLITAKPRNARPEHEWTQLSLFSPLPALTACEDLPSGITGEL